MFENNCFSLNHKSIISVCLFCLMPVITILIFFSGLSKTRMRKRFCWTSRWKISQPRRRRRNRLTTIRRRHSRTLNRLGDRQLLRNPVSLLRQQRRRRRRREMFLEGKCRRKVCHRRRLLEFGRLPSVETNIPILRSAKIVPCPLFCLF
jgi:hypothetical protein